MSTGVPPTALDRLRNQMRQSKMQSQSIREQRQETMATFRQSVRGFLDENEISRAPMSRKDLQELTDVQFFASTNFMNFASFSCVVSVTFCLGWMGWGRDIKDDYKTIHDQYQSLLTNVFWSNAAWLLVFANEAVFVGYQLLSIYKSLPIIELSIGYWFFAANCCHLGWIISYCFDVVWLAALFMAACIGFLVILNFRLYSRDYVSAPLKEGTIPHDRPIVNEDLGDMNIVLEFVVFRMPFQIHLGWAIFTFLVNLNEIWVQYNLTSPGIVSLICIIILWIIGICVLFIPRHPLFVLPVMIAWGAIGICVELMNPRFKILQDYEENDLKRMRGVAIATTIEHLVLPLIRFALHFATTYSLLIKEEPPALPGV